MHVGAAPTTSEANDSKTPGPVKVSPEVMADNIFRKVLPNYPEEAKKAKIQGKVVLEAIIRKDGTVEKVENLKVVSGPKELQPSSLDTVRQWAYKPFPQNGDPVQVKTTITVIYSLQK